MEISSQNPTWTDRLADCHAEVVLSTCLDGFFHGAMIPNLFSRTSIWRPSTSNLIRRGCGDVDFSQFEEHLASSPRACEDRSTSRLTPLDAN